MRNEGGFGELYRKEKEIAGSQSLFAFAGLFGVYRAKTKLPIFGDALRLNDESAVILRSSVFQIADKCFANSSGN
ncbi:MAG: hypothetical protein J5765_04800 [Clostridia bacterium]|nr:hypothetical protein [Clostridia bacterium]